MHQSKGGTQGQPAEGEGPEGWLQTTSLPQDPGLPQLQGQAGGALERGRDKVCTQILKPRAALETSVSLSTSDAT